MSTHFLYILCLLFIALPVRAQLITGTITDRQERTAVDMALVTNKRTKADSRTNTYGRFQIQGLVGDTLLISHPAYSFRTFIVNATDVRISMSANVHKLQEVEVISGMAKFQRDSATRQAIYHKTLKDAQHKTKLSLSNGLALDGIFTSLAYKASGKGKRNKAFAKQLEEDNKMRFTQARYSKELVANLTPLRGDSIALFIEQNPIPYDFVRSAKDIELKMWVRQRYKNWIHTTTTTIDTTNKHD
ncbi:MAG TPA: hypothetical protein VGD89_14990 [Flavipsychrobacter sp.]